MNHWFQYTWPIANTKLMLPGVKLLNKAISVLQNRNSFNVVISVLIYQGGHSAFIKWLFVAFGTATETCSRLISGWAILLSL